MSKHIYPDRVVVFSTEATVDIVILLAKTARKNPKHSWICSVPSHNSPQRGASDSASDTLNKTISYFILHTNNSIVGMGKERRILIGPW